MSTLQEIEFWERVPVPERTRLVHFLVAGVLNSIKGYTGGKSQLALIQDTADVAADITMSLWDHNGKEAA